MKTKITLLFLIIFSFMYSQDNFEFKAVYHLKYKIDSTENTYKTENFILLFNKNKSLFLAEKQYKRDSLLAKNVGYIRARSRYNSKFQEYIMTNLNEQTLLFKENLFNSNFGYVEKINNNIIFTNKQQKINGINCKTAKTKKYGRIWFLDYSDDYPFQFGPYKFIGLPSLVIKARDKQNTYIYELVSIHKIDDKSIKIPPRYQSKYKNLTKSQFNTIKEKIKYSDYIFKDIEFEDPTLKRRLSKKRKLRKLRENNPIELSDI